MRTNVCTQGHSGDVTSVQWCPVKAAKLGKLGRLARVPLASASADGSLRIWDVATGESVKQLQVRACNTSGLDPVYVSDLCLQPLRLFLLSECAVCPRCQQYIHFP